MKKLYRSFDSARKFARNLKLKTRSDWRNYCKSGRKPDDIPATPNGVYENEWKNWYDFFGLEKTPHNQKEFLSFKKARDFMQSLNLRSEKEWRAFSKSGKKPDNIPALPSRTYKKEWKGMGDWLGTGTVAPQKKQFRPFNDAKKVVHRLEIKTKEKWLDYTKSGNNPDDIPTNPPRTYQKDWINWADWLGSEIISPANKSKLWLPWKEAKPLYQKIAKENDLHNKNDWLNYIKTSKLPKGLPAYPQDIYTEKRIKKTVKND